MTRAAAVVGIAGVMVASACAGRTAPAPAATPVTPPVAAAVAARTPHASPTTITAAIDSILSDPKWAAAQWGVLVVDPRTGDTLYSRNAGKLFMPASNQKIITGTVALARLGLDYRWRTAVATEALTSGRTARTTLRGDLYVLGTGDPTVSAAMQHGDAMAPLRALADSLWTRGVRRIEGNVVAWEGAWGTRFPDGPWGFGWEWDDLDTPSGAGVTELLFNEGVARIVVHGGARAGDAARIVVEPTPGALPVDVAASPVLTVTPGDSARGRVRPRWDVARSSYTLTGVVPAGDSARFDVGIRDPRRAYTGALRDALRARGIVVDTTVRWSGKRICPAGEPAPCPPHLDTLAVLTSAPLREVLPALEKPSQNQIAEVLFRTLGSEGTGVGSADSARRVVGDQLRAWGIEPERDVVVRDGSGLSRHDYVTPTTLVRVLDAARRLPTFRVFYDALPVAGVDGTLGTRLRGTSAAGRIHAKTGSIDRVRSLSGYATTADDDVLIFSLLCNNYTTPSIDVTRAQDAIALRLVALHRHDAGVPTVALPPSR